MQETRKQLRISQKDNEELDTISSDVATSPVLSPMDESKDPLDVMDNSEDELCHVDHSGDINIVETTAATRNMSIQDITANNHSDGVEPLIDEDNAGTIGEDNTTSSEALVPPSEDSLSEAPEPIEYPPRQPIETPTLVAFRRQSSSEKVLDAGSPAPTEEPKTKKVFPVKPDANIVGSDE